MAHRRELLVSIGTMASAMLAGCPGETSSEGATDGGSDG